MKQYRDLILRVFKDGEHSGDRTGTGTQRIFGHQMYFDMSDGFPLVTLKRTSFKMIAHELLWFISGNTNIKYLLDNDVHIWDEWADDNGELGPLYGNQWRNSGGRYRKKVGDTWTWDGVDQLGTCIRQIQHNPTSRRIIVDSWNPRLLPDEAISPQENVGIGLMALPPCHMMFQFFVHSDGKLDLQLYQRSVDVFLGLPYNIASYAILLHMVAQVTGTTPGRLVWTGGDIHIYDNHRVQAQQMLSNSHYPLSRLELNSQITDINDFKFEDVILHDYQSNASIKGAISV